MKTSSASTLEKKQGGQFRTRPNMGISRKIPWVRVEWDKPAKVIIDSGYPLFTRMTLLTHWKQEVCPELFAVVVMDLWCCLHMLWLSFVLNDHIKI